MNTNRSQSQDQYDGSTCFPLSSKETGFLSIGKRTAFFILCGISILFLVNVYRYNFIADDSFITLRYARNLIQRNGLVFNPGERIEGFTSMLWTLLLAGFGLLQIDLLLVARILGVMAGLATIILTYRLYFLLSDSPKGSWFALFAPLMLALNGPFACWAGSGMETLLFVCLIVGSYLAVFTDRLLLAALLTSACILTRPEGMFVFALLAAFQFLRARSDKNKRWYGWLIVCSATVAVLFFFRFLYFGDWLPNTYYAKTGGGWNQIIRGFKYLTEYSSDYEGLILMAAPVGFFLLVGNLKSRFLALAVVVFWGATVWVGGDGLPMYRFALSSLPFLLLLQGALVEKVSHHVMRSIPSSPRKVEYCLLVVVIFWAVIHVSKPVSGSHYGLYEYQKKVEIPRWTLVGKWFNEHSSEADSLAAVPIGAVSYYSELHVYDMLGLTDKHIARRKMPQKEIGWAGHEKHDGQYILSKKPTYLLLGNIDVTNKPRNPQNRPFIPYFNRFIWERESDIYDTNLIFELYEARSVQLAPEQYLNFYELKKEFR